MPRQRKRGIKGAGSVYQRKSDNRWVGSFTVEETGKRKDIYADTEKEAWEKLQQAQMEQKQGILATGPQQKVGSYLTQWLETMSKPPTVSARTYVQYRSMIQKHILPTIGHILLQKLTAQRVQTLYAQKLQEGLSVRTVLMLHNILHKSLENAIRWNLITRNITNQVTVPHAQHYEAKTLTVEQAQLLIETAQGHRLEALLIVAIMTGTRRGELLALRWSDIDLERGTLHIQRSMSRVPGYGVIEKDPKTRTSRRKIMLPNIAVEALKEHRLRQNEAKAKVGGAWKELDIVFCNTFGGFLLPESVLQMFYKILKEAELPHIRFHDLRHSAATILLTMGVHPKVVQELLGHSSITMTMDTYSHILPSMHQDARDKMNDAFLREKQD
jgi:integrase